MTYHQRYYGDKAYGAVQPENFPTRNGKEGTAPPLTQRDNLVVQATLNEVIRHLKEVAPDRTLTARALINTALLEAEL